MPVGGDDARGDDCSTAASGDDCVGDARGDVCSAAASGDDCVGDARGDCCSAAASGDDCVGDARGDGYSAATSGGSHGVYGSCFLHAGRWYRGPSMCRTTTRRIYKTIHTAQCFNRIKHVINIY